MSYNFNFNTIFENISSTFFIFKKYLHFYLHKKSKYSKAASGASQHLSAAQIMS